MNARFRPRPVLALGLLLLAAQAQATMRTRDVTWTVGGQAFQGVLVFDDAGAKTRPGGIPGGGGGRGTRGQRRARAWGWCGTGWA